VRSESFLKQMLKTIIWLK